MSRAACTVLLKRLISPLGVRISMDFGLLDGLPPTGLWAKVFSSFVGVKSCVQLFIAALQYDACCWVFFPCFLQ